jgi:hypothetical protein
VVGAPGRLREANCGGRCSDGWRGDGCQWGEEGGKKLGESFGEEKVFLKMKMFWGKEEWTQTVLGGGRRFFF